MNTQAIELFRKSQAAWNRAQHNKGKMEFMSFSNSGNFPYANQGWVSQLEGMFADAKAASAAFAAAVAGMPTEAIVEIITEAGRA